MRALIADRAIALAHTSIAVFEMEHMRQLLRQLCTVVNKYGYMPYGEIAAKEESSPNANTFCGANGVVHELSGYYRLRSHVYDAATGNLLKSAQLRH